MKHFRRMESSSLARDALATGITSLAIIPVALRHFCKASSSSLLLPHPLSLESHGGHCASAVAVLFFFSIPVLHSASPVALASPELLS